jgi:DNA-binding MarR family transcriptional regulator
MLLDLFVSEQHGRKVSVTSACIAADVPGTTALRWLDVLESKGLIVRTSAERDERVRYVSLTVEARRALCELLARQASEHR